MRGDSPRPQPAQQRDESRAPATGCHYFIKAGQIEFCGDSTYALAGQTVQIFAAIPELDVVDGGKGDFCQRCSDVASIIE